MFPYPVPGDQQEPGIGDKIEQVIEPAMRIITGPAVQLGLDLQYPGLRPAQGQLQFVGIHQRDSCSSRTSTADLLAPFAMYAPLTRSDYYGASATSRGHQPTTGLPSAWLAARREGRHQDASHVHHHPVDERAVQLYPGSIAAPTPQAFGGPPRRHQEIGFGVATRRWRALHPAHILQIGAGGKLTGLPALVPLVRRLVLLAGPASSGSPGASRRCQGCSHPRAHLHVQAALSFTSPLRQASGGGPSPPPG